MSSEKTSAIVIRQVDFSESSRIVTLFSKGYGKLSVMAKGAKRLKSAFDSSLDLLNECEIVFIRKPNASLDLLTSSALLKRFTFPDRNLQRQYASYYIAELLDASIEVNDPHEYLYEQTRWVLDRLAEVEEVPIAVVVFEVLLIQELGLLPDTQQCHCGKPIETNQSYRLWASQGQFLCHDCHSEEIPSQPFSGLVIQLMAEIVIREFQLPKLTSREWKPLHQIASSCLNQAIGRRPKTLKLLQF